MEPEIGIDGLPTAVSLKKNFETLEYLMERDLVAACRTLGYGGIAEAIYKMSIGNRIGFMFGDDMTNSDIFAYNYGTFVIELTEEVSEESLKVIGRTLASEAIVSGGTSARLQDLDVLYEDKLENVYPCNVKSRMSEDVSDVIYRTREMLKPREAVHGKPRVLVPVFPGTNCEYDAAKAIESAGGEANIFVVNNMNAEMLKRSVEDFSAALSDSQAMFIPGGFSGADEPDGSGKFITSFLRNEEISEGIKDMLNKRDGLIAGICNGFQALVKLGLLPYGEISMQTESSPTLTFNDIGRHQSKLVRTKICSTKSPWLRETAVDQIVTVPISHGEGKFVATDDDLDTMISNGQIVTQYVDLSGNPTMDIQYNPNGSVMAIEGIVSPDGRILGKMGHSERVGKGLYKNVPGEFELRLFESAINYFKAL